MTPSLRRWVFLAGIGGLVAFYLWGLLGLPGFGSYPGPYGFVLNRIAVSQTKATGVVSDLGYVPLPPEAAGQVLASLRHE